MKEGAGRPALVVSRDQRSALNSKSEVVQLLFYNGVLEYFKYPAETLYDMRGDCEDTSILYCALMKHMGYEVALCDYTGDEYMGRGHMAAAVYVPSRIYGTYYNMSGKEFYYCETTSDTMKVGEGWDEYNSAYVIIIT